MPLAIELALTAEVERALASRFGIQTQVTLEQPKQSAFGEFAIPIAFQLARQLRLPPRQIATELVAAMSPVEAVEALEIAGNGYINVRLQRSKFALTLRQSSGAGSQLVAGQASQGKIIVEHTNINPNKAAHIGHLRNAVLGDTFVRMLRQNGREVEVQNYIDNTGVQVADVVAGFHFLEHQSLEEVKALIADSRVRFDYLCWDLYARISTYFKDNPSALAWRTEVLHAIESGHGSLAEMGSLVSDTIVLKHLSTMLRLGIVYDVLPRESEILHLHFWATAFELLKQRKAIYYEEHGKNKGCWVMPSSAFREKNELAPEEDDSKVIVRSNGTVTYVGKDIAYQLWKFGLLGKDFYYRDWFRYSNGHQLWVTTADSTVGQPAHFGHAARVYNVIDSRQSYLQDVVVAGLRALSFEKAADASIHFSYEMVALTPRTCQELGIALSDEDKGRPYVEVSGRKGLGVKADDLIDKLLETALIEVSDRHPERPAEDRERTARMVAVGALRYFLLKFTRSSVIAFDFHEALSFEGETGPYVQYAGVRAARILDKWRERFGEIPDFSRVLTEASLRTALKEESVWQLLLLASKLDSVIERAIESGEPAHVVKYSFQLAQSFNTFYRDSPVLSEPDEEIRTVLLWTTRYVFEQIARTLGVLGIEQPTYM